MKLLFEIFMTYMSERMTKSGGIRFEFYVRIDLLQRL
jgi:hypothetical protein